MNGSLLKWRKDKGWSQEEFARRLDVEPSMISKWERGTVMPSLPHAKKILEVTNGEVTLDDLVNAGGGRGE
jgi:transcriptional regulator with XRE-family HTH domain